MTRSRTRRGPKPRPCSDAARFHVSFHDKHSRRRPRILFICPADGRIRLEARQRRVGETIFTAQKTPPLKKTASYMCDILIASVVIRLLSARCIKSSRNDTKLTAVGVSSRRRVPTRSSDARRFVLLIGDGCSLLCFILQKGAFSVSPLPLAFVAQNVLSAPHITGEPPKNCAPARCKNTYIPCWAPFNPPRQREKNDKKRRGVKMTRKENVTKM